MRFNPYRLHNPRSSFHHLNKGVQEMSRPASATVYHEVRGKCIRETEKAFLFTPTHVGGYETREARGASWFPFSQISTKFCLTGDCEHWFMASEWILGQKDLSWSEPEIGEEE